jgi:hypothetical protein
MRFLAGLLEPFGSDVGGMLVTATGRDAANRPVAMRWSLAAPAGIGPNIPVIPALALIERLASGQKLPPGARAAAGDLRYGELAIHLKRIGASLNVSLEPVGPPHLFEKVLGPAWPVLPPVTRRLHTVDPSIILEGEADVTGASNVLGRVIARLFGFPRAGKTQPLRVVIEREGGSELWSRHYPNRVMKSVMTAADPATRTLEEHFGSFRFRLRLEADSRGIDMVPEAAFWRSIPLPRAVLSAITARERASDDGRHLFDVEIALKPLGRLVHYRGWLRPVSPE